MFGASVWWCIGYYARFRNTKGSTKPPGPLWCEKIIDKFEEDREKRPHELKQFLLEAMVVLPSNLQCSASDWFDRARLLPGTTRDDRQILRSTSYNNNDEQRTIVYRANDDIDDQRISLRKIIRKRPTLVLASCSSSERLSKSQDIDDTGIEPASR